MPHVQVIGPCKVAALAEPLADYSAATPPLILKVRDTYVNPTGNHLVLEALVVEGYLRQGFFLLMREEEKGVIIRCHPFSAVQKTDGVKRLIAQLGQRCLELCPGSRIGNTNLGEFLTA